MKENLKIPPLGSGDQGFNMDTDTTPTSARAKSARMNYRRQRTSTASSLGSERSRSRSRSRRDRSQGFDSREDLEDIFTHDDDDVFVSPANSARSSRRSSRAGSPRRRQERRSSESTPTSSRNNSQRRNRNNSDSLGEEFESMNMAPFNMVRLINPGLQRSTYGVLLKQIQIVFNNWYPYLPLILEPEIICHRPSTCFIKLSAKLCT